MGGIVPWVLGLPDLPRVEHSSLATNLQRGAAKVKTFCNIWYVGSAASEGRAGAAWEPQGRAATSIPGEPDKNKTDIPMRL